MDGIATVWDLTKQAEWKKIKPPVDTILTSVAFAPDEKGIALAYGDGAVAIWDIDNAGADASETLVMRGHTGTVLDLAFSSDGERLASASLDRTARLWQLQTARRPRIKQAHEGMAFHAVAKNGRYIRSGGSDQKVQVWTVPISEPSESVLLDSQPRAVAISEDGKRAFIGTDRGDLLQWDTSGSVPTPFSRDNGSISAIAISPDGETLVAIGVAGKFQVCSVVPSPPQCEPVSDLGGWGYSVAFSQDGDWVGAAAGIEGSSGLALVRNLNTNESTLLKGHTERISSIQFSKSGDRAVTVSWDGTARIWDPSSSRELVRLIEPKGRLSSAGFSPDGEWIATISNDKTLRLWKVPRVTDATQTVLMEAMKGRLLSDTTNLGQLKFSPSGDMLAGSLENGNINLWHVPDGTLRAALEGDGSPIRSMYFQPNGLQITAATENGRLISWKVSPVLGLPDYLLLSVARSMLPLSGSLAGKLEEGYSTQSVTSVACAFVHEHNLGLPPHNLSGSARARQQVSIPDTCSPSVIRKEDSKILVEGLVSEAEGDLVTARQKFITASSKGEFVAEIGLGDLSFVDSLNGAAEAGALGHYIQAREHRVPHAASRLGWLLLVDGAKDKIAQAKGYFEESSRDADADGSAGLAWLNDRFGDSFQDLKAAFSNYVKAQYEYERDGDLMFAQEVAERRAMLARFFLMKVLLLKYN
jgi:WD40 repeat protein